MSESLSKLLNTVAASLRRCGIYAEVEHPFYLDIKLAGRRYAVGTVNGPFGVDYVSDDQGETFDSVDDIAPTTVDASDLQDAIMRAIELLTERNQ